MKRMDVVYAFIYDENQDKVLMVKNRRGSSFEYTLPGGAVEERETLEQAAIRETKEETGFHIEVGSILAVNEAIFEKRGHHAIFFTFLARITGGEMNLSRPEEIADISWMDLDEADQWMPYLPGGVSKLLKNKYSAPYMFQGK
ncbi:NUDIX hydrolase [Melghirimyces algeriensis]|uniref:8-oxo-dGTP diphosphatase n=1 Tax=Melghirimyces algeriensis TaxID=910412 RepID=A0A521EUB2_9BACL|nr:NUDIX hydrolase [Melghirimyces algeriensis]SMO87011.1 8-oxo-dGTP diphosphatase [Melghirimyces algeriensis]